MTRTVLSHTLSVLALVSAFASGAVAAETMDQMMRAQHSGQAQPPFNMIIVGEKLETHSGCYAGGKCLNPVISDPSGHRGLDKPTFGEKFMMGLKKGQQSTTHYPIRWWQDYGGGSGTRNIGQYFRNAHGHSD